MSQLSFAYVPQSGFAAFHASMKSNPWSLVDSSSYDDPTKPLWNAPPLILIKTRLTRATQALLVAMVAAGGAKGCDRNWDGAQKELNGLLGIYADSNDPAKRDAAKRLQHTLLLGAGMAQTQLRYQEEVDFGRKQVELVASGQGAQDVAMLGLGSLMNEIALTTEALASVIGHGTTSEPPHARRAKAMAMCIVTFLSASDSLQWLIEHAGNSAERDIALALFGSLKDLAERYPAALRNGRAGEKSVPEKPIAAPPPSVH